MNIGILSMQKIKNNGSFLQAYALKHICESYGHKVIWVDFKRNPIQKVNDQPDSIRKISYSDKLVKATRYAFFRTFRKKIKAGKMAMKFWNTYEEWYKDLGEDGGEKTKNFDRLIIGSDEVFNALQYVDDFKIKMEIPWELFGEGYEDKRIISYAASAGQTNYDKLINKDLGHTVKKLLNNFEKLSVRDKNTQEMLQKFGFNSQINIDPVLLYDFHDVELQQPKEHDYILVYAYDMRISKEEGKEIRAFAKKHNKKIVCVNFFQDFADIYKLVHPLQVLAYFKYADYVVTDTFHGAIMSMKYHKQFGIFVRNSNYNKLSYLLGMFGLTDRMVTSKDKLGDVLLKNADYNTFIQVLQAEQKKGYDYLEEFLL